MRFNNALNLINLSIILGFGAGCVTSGEQKVQSMQQNTANSDRAVLMAAGFPQPQLTPKSTAELQDDAKSKDPEKRLRALLATGQERIAIQDAQGHLRNHPDSPMALEILVVGHALSKDFQLAAYYAGRLQTIQPGHPAALNVLGMAAVLEKSAGFDKYRRAIAYFQQSYERGHRAAGLNLAEVYLITGSARDALPIYQAIAADCDRCITAHIGSGIAANRVDQFKAAKIAFHRALELDPNNAKALYHLALTERNGFQNQTQATKHLEQLLASSNDLGAKERAQALMRQMKGEMPVGERLAANEEERQEKSAAAAKQNTTKVSRQQAQATSSAKPTADAELLLIDAEDQATNGELSTP